MIHWIIRNHHQAPRPGEGGVAPAAVAKLGRGPLLPITWMEGLIIGEVNIWRMRGVSLLSQRLLLWALVKQRASGTTGKQPNKTTRLNQWLGAI